MDTAELVDHLADLADAQRTAAMAFDVAAVDRLTRERADTLFELQISMRRELSDDVRQRVRERIPRLQRAERRLASVVGAVAKALAPPPARAATYGRRGHVR